MDENIPTPAGECQRARGGVRSFFGRDGEISVEELRPEGLGADVGTLACDPVVERLAQERARDLASAAEMSVEPDWVVRERERARKWHLEEREREAREAREQAQRREASLRESFERMDRLRDEGLGFAGFADPDEAAAAEQARAREDAAWREVQEGVLAAVRGELGRWTTDSVRSLDATAPLTAEEHRDAKRLGRSAWAMARLAMNGALRDLAYVLERMRLEVGDEILGSWVIEAMGLQADGRTALRQLHALKARRKLVRSYALWRCGSYGELRDYAGSPSTRRVRGVRRCPQTLLARVCAIGGRPWHRSTTTRDANEAHRSGLWRRVRLPQDTAPEEERAGPSGQVVSRYVFDLPEWRAPRARRHKTRMESLSATLGGASSDAGEWVGWVARHACRLAQTTLEQLRSAALARAAAPPG
jgi:hypothetical protein